jgi:hypothetical protein
MYRPILFALCLLAASLNTVAQLPNQNGQVWCEYPITVPPGNMKIYNDGQAKIDTTPQSIVEFIRRSTGEAAWVGENFGLISYDGQKLYVYHAPPMQQQIAEIVERFTRPETRNIQFITECTFYSLSKSGAAKRGYTDVREPIVQYLHGEICTWGGMEASTPNVRVYYVLKDNIPKVQKQLQLLTPPDYKHDSALTFPRVTTFNGQIGGCGEFTKTPSGGESWSPTEGHAPLMLDSGMSIQSFSLLSQDRQIVMTDFSVVFSAIKEVNFVGFCESMSKAIPGKMPQTHKIEITEHGIPWGADGMLLVFVDGIGEQEEVQKEETSEIGTPVLNRIPYVHRLFKNTAVNRVVREATTTSGIITVRLANESPQ